MTIEIQETTVYRGPNIWARTPAVHLLVGVGELAERSTDQIPGFADRLLALLPSLEGCPSSPSDPDGFGDRLRAGTSFGDVLQHIALELQRLAGANVSRGETRRADMPGHSHIVFECYQGEVGRAAGHLACRLLNHLVFGSEPDFDVTRELEENVVRLAGRLGYGPSTKAVVEEAERRGIPVLRIHPDQSLIQLGHGRFQQRTLATLPSSTSHVAVLNARSKELTNKLLRDVGLPAPHGVLVSSAEEAVGAAARIGYPVVLKPPEGNHGRGVCLDIGDEAAVRATYPTAAAQSRTGAVLVERFVPGKDYRVLVINDQVVAVAERVPAHVFGDGEHTVRELVERANADPRRGVGHEKVLTRFAIDAQMTDALARQGLTLDAVAAPGRFVGLKLMGNMSTGGTSIDRTDDIHPDNVQIARDAAMAVGLDVAGIDVVAADISRSIREVGGAIVELNAAPGFRMHTHPTEGTPRPVGRAFVDLLYPPGTPSRVPIVAVTGTNGKTTTSRMVAHIMGTAGCTVGLTTTDGIYIDGTQVAAGDLAGPESARLVLKHPRVDGAVLETARGGILRSGLGFDRCNVAVVTNVSSDHLGLRGIDTLADLARVKAVVPSAVHHDGASVLNADNPWTVAMAREAQGEVILFSVDEASPVVHEHLRGQGRAVVLRKTPAGELLMLVGPGHEEGIVLAGDIPATWHGRLRANVANALAAAAAAIGLGIDLAVIRQALSSFSTGFAQTPGRFNLVVIEGRQVLMDYGHNVGALEAVADVVRRTGARRTIGVIAQPGDRRDVDIRAFGELASRTFDRLVVREGANKRGRPEGEAAALLHRAVLDAGMPPDRACIVLDEVEAAHAAIDLAEPGDLVVAQVDRVPLLWEALMRRATATPAPPLDGETAPTSPATVPLMVSEGPGESRPPVAAGNDGADGQRRPRS